MQSLKKRRNKMPLLPRRPLITAFIVLAVFCLVSGKAFPQDQTGTFSDSTKNWLGIQVNSSEKLRVTATGSVGIGTAGPGFISASVTTGIMAR